MHIHYFAATHSLHSQHTFVDALCWNLNMNKIFRYSQTDKRYIVLTLLCYLAEYVLRIDSMVGGCKL